MATTTVLPNNSTNPKYFDYLTKFKKEAAYFENERTASGRPWPRAKPPVEVSYDRWIADVIDPTTGDYYLNEEGKIPAKYVVDMIIRLKLIDGSEVLLSQGDIKALDYFKDVKTFRCDKPEMHIKTLFEHKRVLDDRNRIIRRTTGTAGSEEIYELPFTPENLDKLWSMKRDGNIQLIVKSQLNGEPHALERKGILRPNDVEGAYRLFRDSDFEYLYNWEYQKETTVTFPATPKTNPPVHPVTGEIVPTDAELQAQMDSDYHAMVEMNKQMEEIDKLKLDTKTEINKSDNPKKVVK